MKRYIFIATLILGLVVAGGVFAYNLSDYFEDGDVLLFKGKNEEPILGFTPTPSEVRVSDGTVSAPTMTFVNDRDSGIYRIGSNNIGVGVNSTKILDINTSGLTITGTVTANTAIFSTSLTSDEPFNVGDGTTTSTLEGDEFWVGKTTTGYGAGTFYVNTLGALYSSSTLNADTLIANGSGDSLGLYGYAANSAGNTGVKIGNYNTLSDADARIASFYTDVGTTERAYIDSRGNFTQGNGTVSSTLTANTLILNKATSFDVGKFYVDSSSNVSASGSLKTFGNVTSTGNLYALTGTASTSILNGSSLTLGQGTSYNSGMFSVDSNGNVSASGTIAVVTGSVTAPSLFTPGYPTTGLYYGANLIYFAINGTGRMYVSSNGIDANRLAAYNNQTLTLTGRSTDSASAIGIALDNVTTLSTAGAKLVSFQNNTTEKSFISKNGSYIQNSATANTTNNTATTILTFTPPDSNSIYDIDVTIFASSTLAGTTDMNTYKLNQMASTTASGAVALIGSPISINTQESSSSWNGTLTASGSTILCQGTGELGVTIYWRCSLTFKTLK